nr:MAG TPA: hypothetical protein [Bacteriophage sp.]
MQYKLKDDWMSIAETSGTLYAPERAVEISTEKVNGSGFILNPLTPFPFKGTIFARAANGHADLNVVNVTLPTN